MDPTVLLLTACVDPGGTDFIRRKDPQKRLEDYRGALKSWLLRQRAIRRIVFCENSEYPLGSIREVVERFGGDKEVEIIQFFGQDFAGNLGKGYGHLKTIDYAVSNSTMLAYSDGFLTVTGRYFVANIEGIVRNISAELDICCDLQNLRYADVRVMWFKKAVYDCFFRGIYDSVNDSAGCYMEHVIARRLLMAILEGHSWSPLPRTPYLVGYSGTDGSKLNSLGQSLKWLAKEATRRVGLVPGKRFRAFD